MSLRFFHCKNHIFHDLNGLLRNLPSTFVAAPFGSPTAGSSTPAPALSWPQKRQNLGNRIMKSYQCQPGTKPNIWRTSYLNISITIFKAIWKKDTHTHTNIHTSCGLNRVVDTLLDDFLGRSLNKSTAKGSNFESLIFDHFISIFCHVWSLLRSKTSIISQKKQRNRSVLVGNRYGIHNFLDFETRPSAIWGKLECQVILEKDDRKKHHRKWLFIRCTHTENRLIPTLHRGFCHDIYVLAANKHQ